MSVVSAADLPSELGRPDDVPARTIAGEPLRRFVLVALGLLALAVTMVMLAVVRGPQLSPYDEPQHADYAYQISHGTIPSKGSVITPEIRYEWSCHGLGNSTSDGCAAVDGDFGAGEQDYTFGDPPVYYLATGVIARVASALVPGSGQFIDMGRAVGVLWLFAAMLLLYLALRRFRVSWQCAAAAAVLLALCPGVLGANSTMTSDAPAALCGAAALWVLAGITVERRTGWLVPALVTMLAAGTKILNGMPILAVGVVTLVLAVNALRRSDRQATWYAARQTAAIFGSFLLVYLGWAFYQGHRGDPGWVNPNAANGKPLTGDVVGDLLSNLFSTFQHLTTSYWLAPQINGESVTIWATLLSVVLAAAPLMVMAISRSRSWGWTLGLAAFAGVTAVSLVVEFQVFAEDHSYFTMVAPRYALSFIPWVIACLAVVAGRRRLTKTSLAFAGMGTVVILLAETGLFTLGPALVGQASFLIG